MWHGGEPMLAGIDFFHQAIEFESKWVKTGKEIFNAIQTNGILLNKNWLDFFVSNFFNVGVSLDGSPKFHNQIRKSISGNNSFDKIINSIHLLNEAGILSNVICCVSSVNYNYPEEIFNFFVSQGIKKLKFLPVQGRDKNGKVLSYGVTGEQYANFLLTIFDLWLKLDDPEVEIREIKSIVNLLLGGNFRECIFTGECYKYFTIYPDGSVYSCDSLPKTKFLYFGNIGEGLDKIVSSWNFVRFRDRVKELKEKCCGCEWFEICRDGCLKDWWPDIFDPSAKNLFCRGFKKIFTKIRKTLKEYQMI
ncbi:MAG: SPASM domain-containing protein [Candidatus Paceibacterota bacterium]|nr:SPASM domain-containing protein [Candidatus Paceibacterota bacterium]